MRCIRMTIFLHKEAAYHAVAQYFMPKLKYSKTTEKYAATENKFQAALSSTVFWTKAQNVTRVYKQKQYSE